MKILFTQRTTRLTDRDIEAAMDELLTLRTEVAVAEVEDLLRSARSNVRVLRPRGTVHNRA
jgi:hypothetical protein